MPVGQRPNVIHGGINLPLRVCTPGRRAPRSSSETVCASWKNRPCSLRRPTPRLLVLPLTTAVGIDGMRSAESNAAGFSTVNPFTARFYGAATL